MFWASPRIGLTTVLTFPRSNDSTSFACRRGTLNEFPGLTDVFGFSVRLTHTKSERVPVIQYRVSQIQFSALIETLQETTIEFVSRPVRKANQVERRGSDQFEIF